MSDSSSLDSSEQLRSAASYRAQRPARVLGKTDLSWTLAAPPAAPAVEPEPEPEPAFAPEPNAEGIARSEALAWQAHEAELARMAEAAERAERERQAALAAQQAERERTEALERERAERERADTLAARQAERERDEDQRLWDEAIARESSVDESEAARRRARVVIRDVAETPAGEPADDAAPKNVTAFATILRALGFRPKDRP